MTGSPGLIWTVLAFIAALAPLVVVHELGHYLAARWCGVKSDVFSIGFGPRLFGWKDKHGTDWRVAAFPLGGYVKFAGDMSAVSEPNEEWKALPDAERAKTFQAQPLLQRAWIVFAGPLANFLLAILILSGFALAYGKSVTPPVVDQIVAGSPAEKAGLKLGDRVISINGRTTVTFDDVSAIVQDRPDSALDMIVERSGMQMPFTVTAATRLERDRFGNEYRIGRIGIGTSGKNIRQEKVGLLAAPVYATGQVFSIMDRMVSGLWQIISGRRPVEELGGPIKIAQISGQVATLGFSSFLWFLALISINLGFINLLPIPMLDGGHLAFYALEAIRRRPVSPRVMDMAFRTGLVLVLGLMFFVTANDLGSLGLWRRLGSLFG